ncbi:DNA polymerase III subunit delta' [Pantoea sp. 1.19]|uniref:DNA polymerase III subunit delta' n=1 Tax=Pantoea sp. 1.19 TaxID=1925589 RepID=UPI000948EC2B|nr:DNA polymerase III subunit delta' [Pantoea sp. 1.19]
MQWYPWLNAPYRQLIAQHQQGRAHHAVLVYALPGMGEAALAWGVSRWLLCQRPAGLKSCGVCHGCQLMQAGNHPDWHALAVDKGKSSLGIDAVRQLSDTLWHHAQQGGARVVWVPDANALTEAAANALLKTLEEPPQNCWFLLGSREPGRLLATLRSRCLLWHLPPPPEAQSLAWLRKQRPVDEAAGVTALRLCSGAPGAALALLDASQWQQRQQLCDALFALTEQGDLLALLPVLNQEDAPRRIGWLCSLLVDALKCHRAAGAGMQNADRLPLVHALARWLTAPQLDSALRQWLRCRDRLRHVVAVNRELLITEQLLEWERRCNAVPGKIERE